MSASNTFETNLLQLIFNGTSFANIADNTATAPATNLYVSLHTADPGETGTQSTSEATYTGYARVAVVRTTAGWTVVNPSVMNAAQVNFPAATGGTSTVTHFGIGLGSTGTGTLLFSGALLASLAISNGITASFNAGDLSVTCD